MLRAASIRGVKEPRSRVRGLRIERGSRGVQQVRGTPGCMQPIVLSGSLDCVAVRFANDNLAQDDNSRLFESNAMHVNNDELEIHKLFEDGDRALIAADQGALSRIFADDYIQYNESGNSFTKHEVIQNLVSGKILYLSMISTARQIHLLRDDVALVHGSEDDEVEQAGRRFQVRYVYTDIVMKRNGRWQIVASQLAMPS